MNTHDSRKVGEAMSEKLTMCFRVGSSGHMLLLDLKFNLWGSKSLCLCSEAPIKTGHFRFMNLQIYCQAYYHTSITGGKYVLKKIFKLNVILGMLMYTPSEFTVDVRSEDHLLWTLPFNLATVP